MPRCASLIRCASESYARSAINRLGCGALRLGSRGGTIVSSSVASRSFTSAGEADARRMPTGIPWPSATTMHFVPLPRFVLPTHSPLFLRGKSWHRQTLLPSRANLLRRGRPERCATPPPKRLALPNREGDASTCWAKGIDQEDPASAPRCATSTICLQARVDCRSACAHPWVSTLLAATTVQ